MLGPCRRALRGQTMRCGGPFRRKVNNGEIVRGRRIDDLSPVRRQNQIETLGDRAKDATALSCRPIKDGERVVVLGKGGFMLDADDIAAGEEGGVEPGGGQGEALERAIEGTGAVP